MWRRIDHGGCGRDGGDQENPLTAVYQAKKYIWLKKKIGEYDDDKC
jgi:hypothetical protein